MMLSDPASGRLLPVSFEDSRQARACPTEETGHQRWARESEAEEETRSVRDGILTSS
jgi:hypothetical protein